MQSVSDTPSHPLSLDHCPLTHSNLFSQPLHTCTSPPFPPHARSIQSLLCGGGHPVRQIHHKFQQPTRATFPQMPTQMPTQKQNVGHCRTQASFNILKATSFAQNNTKHQVDPMHYVMDARRCRGEYAAVQALRGGTTRLNGHKHTHSIDVLRYITAGGVAKLTPTFLSHFLIFLGSDS